MLSKDKSALPLICSKKNFNSPTSLKVNTGSSTIIWSYHHCLRPLQLTYSLHCTLLTDIQPSHEPLHWDPLYGMISLPPHKYFLYYYLLETFSDYSIHNNILYANSIFLICLYFSPHFLLPSVNSILSYYLLSFVILLHYKINSVRTRNLSGFFSYTLST